MSKYFSDTERNKMTISKWFIPITLSWFSLSALLGWLCSFFIKPFDFLSYIYSYYCSLIVQCDSFCLAMFFSFTLAPIAAFFYLTKGFRVLYFKKWKTAVSLSMALLGMYAAMGLLTLENSGKKAMLARDLLKIFDWLGAFLICFTGLYLAVSGLVLAIGSTDKLRS